MQQIALPDLDHTLRNHAQAAVLRLELAAILSDSEQVRAEIRGTQDLILDVDSLYKSLHGYPPNPLNR